MSNRGALTLAIGYGGRQEIIDAVRDLLTEADGPGSRWPTSRRT